MNKYKLKNLQTSSDGFTIVETLIAMAIFSLMLLILITVVIQLTRTYYGGIVDSTVNNTALDIVNNIAQAIQTSEGDITGSTIKPLTPGSDYAAFCVDNQRYSYQIGYEAEPPPLTANPLTYQAPHAMVLDFDGNCPDPGNSGKNNGRDPYNPLVASNVRDLVGPNMRLSIVSVARVTELLWKIQVRVVYGNYLDLCSPTDGDCPSGPFTLTDLSQPDLTCQEGISEEFCAVSDISTYVENRVQ